MGFMLGTARAADNKHEAKAKKQSSTQIVKERVVYVEVTGSRIPQRVVLRGQQVDSASPVFVVQGDELSRTGATSVVGMLALDPSIWVGHRH